MRIIKVTNVEKFAARAVRRLPQKKTTVESILKNVKKDGDKAIRRYEKMFGGVNISSLRVSQSEIKDAYSKVSKTQLDALHSAKARLEKTEYAIKSLLKNVTINNAGVRISKRFTPIQSIGCYVPGGLARYPSSVIMSAVPARIAGVKRIVAVSPPNSEGGIDPMTIVAADICGVNEIYKTGGAQAIAGLCYGTRSIPKVDKIVGPGGSFVTAAKSMISSQTGIDMLAGPTELGIMADNTADPNYIALDLISQAEHSGDTLCYLITTSKRLAESVRDAVSEILPRIQRRAIVSSSLKNNGFIAICKNKSDMIRLANILAPEHLQIMTKNAESVSSKITTSGLVLIGDYCPSSASDYIFGSNHVLPTNGFGRIRGSLSVLDFVKINTQVTSSKSSLSKISKHLEVLTESEGLPNHYEAVKGRLK